METGAEKFTNAATEGDLATVQGLAGQVSEDEKEEALRGAAESGHLEVVTYLINEFGVEVDARDDNEDTALMLAANNGHMDVVKYLAEQCGADANASNSWGETAFKGAAENGYIDLVRYLVEHCGADANAEDNRGDTAFRGTVKNGHLEVVRYLAEHCGSDVNSHGDSAFMLAANEGHVDVVQFLVEHCGADVNAKDSFGATALSSAAESGHLAVVQYLAEQCGADVNVKNDYGETGFLSAAKRGHTDIIRYLAEHCGADVNAKSDRDTTALMWAAGSGHTDVVRYLVEHCGANANANANAKDNDGDTALIHAARFGYADIVRYLIECCSVDTNTKNESGYTALIWAAENGHVDVVRCLGGQCEVDVNAKTDDGYTALMKAAVDGYVDVVRYLTEHCAVDVNEKLDGKYTALMLAAETGEAAVVEYLAGQGADLNALDDFGYTALMKAAENGHEDVVECLAVQYRADVNAKSFSGSTALRLAAERGYEEIQRVLMPLILPDSSVTPTIPEVVVELPPSCSIDPSEVELTHYSQTGHIGGDFQAKWLDADAVVKIFIPDASYSSFGDEVRMWQQLRHPNVLKMYGACDAGHHLLFFVCEYASQGSLLEHVKSSAEGERSTMWKYLFEAALGLEYLHERGLVHGEIRCSNILIGSDGLAKLSNFGLSGLIKTPVAASDTVVGSMRWQAPEVVKGAPPSIESDVYSLGMCILEAVTKEEPWGEATEEQMKMEKLNWVTDDELYAEFRPYCPQGDAHELVWEMCSQDPHKRASLSSVVYKLEHLAAEENTGSTSQPEQEPVSSFEEYAFGKVQQAWLRLETYMEKCDNMEHCAAFDQLKPLHERLQVSVHHPALLERFHALVTEFYQTVKMSPDQALMTRLSSTRATSNSLHAFQWRIESLMASLGGITERNNGSGWQQQRPDETKLLVAGLSDIFLVLQKLTTTEERAAYLKTLRAEMENPLEKYTPEELNTMRKAYEDITSKLETEDWSELIPEWFIPWYELIIDEWDCLGEGGFGSVNRAKWLDSEVVVKRVTLPGSSGKTDASTTCSSLSTSEGLYATEADADPDQRNKALEMFRREVEIWFGFSHPHVIRLFGACHVGRPFFVCEYATNGALVSYLREHPDELWSKLHEAALGVQYLHARDVVHGDLKGNNIVIGSDFKAKVTDFGLSSAASSEDTAQISGAWHWVAPECFPDAKAGEDQQQKRPSFASDVYSMGLCIVEALRVVEAVKAGKDSRSCLPWRVADRNVVRYHATRGMLPARPLCSDSQWKLVERMCTLDPKQRIKISTVVDELARLANSPVNTQALVVPADATNPFSVPDIVAAAQEELARLQGDTDQHDAVLSRCASLWKRIECVHEQIADKDCRASFHSVVADARASTAALQERKRGASGDRDAVLRVGSSPDKALRSILSTWVGGGAKTPSPRPFASLGYSLALRSPDGVDREFMSSSSKCNSLHVSTVTWVFFFLRSIV